MKKFIKILIVLLVIAAILLVVFFFKNRKNNNSNEPITEEEALEIANSRYESLLNFTKINHLQLSGNDNIIDTFEIDGKVYFKIENFDETIGQCVSDEFLEEFFNIAQIIVKDGEYYINQSGISREYDITYNSTILIMQSCSNEEIKCEAQSTYYSYDNEATKVSQDFVLKNIDGVWKVIEFSLPY